MHTMKALLSASKLSSNFVLKRTTRSAAAISLLLLASNASAFASESTFRKPLTTLASSPSDEPREGKTGWNHNPPKNPDFYSAASQVEAIAKEINPPPEKKFRTGWLHNTESPESAPKTAASTDTSTKQKSSAAGKARRRLEEAMKASQENHRIISPAALHPCSGRQIVVTEHRVSVPLVHPPEEELKPATAGAMPSMPKKVPTIDVAFKIVEEVKDEETRQWYQNVFATLNPAQRAAAYKKRCGMTSAKDMILWLQGGPGFGAPSPVSSLGFGKGGGSWGAAALDKYQRVVLMDQRGTGSSTPITKQSLERRFPDLFSLDGQDFEDTEEFSTALKEATDFMAQFRADNIVKDAEFIRKVLMYTPTVDDEEMEDFDATKEKYDASKPNPWGAVIGQSFGGFCTMTYLSQVEYPPKICLLTGGIAPMLCGSASDVYTALWDKVRERNFQYYDMYPGDVAVVKSIVKQLLIAEKEGATPILPSGGKLTARRFLQLGMNLGGSPSSFASMHDLLAKAFLQPLSKDDPVEFSRGFLKAIDNDQPFDEYPIYFWLHESIYADANNKAMQQRSGGTATNWSANSAYEFKLSTKSSDAVEYDYRVTSADDCDLPVLFFGEMVFPWMAEDYDQCSGRGCTALASALHTKQDWGPLYDADNMRAALKGKSRAAAAVYYEDMYVDFDHSMAVAARGGPLQDCKLYITNEYQHSGVRDDGASIFNKLHGMASGTIRTPS